MRKLSAFIVVFMCLPVSALASPITGSRSTPDTSGVVAADGWSAAENGFQISWEISYLPGQNQAMPWRYIYVLTQPGSSSVPVPDLSHWMLEVSDVITSANWTAYIDVTSGTASGLDDFTSTSHGNSNPGLPGTLHGIKFSSTSVGFWSSEAPVWGDFYAKDGKHEGVFAAAWNTGISLEPTSTSDFTRYIARPDGDGILVPEPGLCALAAMGVVTGIWARRRARKGKADGIEDAAA